MTDQLRVAAQALLDAHDRCATIGEIVAGWDALRTALSAPHPTADERVAEHMKLVRLYGDESYGCTRKVADAYAAVESSVRALLAAGLEDASQALAFRMLVRHWNEFGPEHGFGELIDRLQTSAMQKGTP